MNSKNRGKGCETPREKRRQVHRIAIEKSVDKPAESSTCRYQNSIRIRCRGQVPLLYRKLAEKLSKSKLQESTRGAYCETEGALPMNVNAAHNEGHYLKVHLLFYYRVLFLLILAAERQTYSKLKKGAPKSGAPFCQLGIFCYSSAFSFLSCSTVHDHYYSRCSITDHTQTWQALPCRLGIAVRYHARDPLSSV